MCPFHICPGTLLLLSCLEQFSLWLKGLASFLYIFGPRFIVDDNGFINIFIPAYHVLWLYSPSLVPRFTCLLAPLSSSHFFSHAIWMILWTYIKSRTDNWEKNAIFICLSLAILLNTIIFTCTIFLLWWCWGLKLWPFCVVDKYSIRVLHL